MSITFVLCHLEQCQSSIYCKSLVCNTEITHVVKYLLSLFLSDFRRQTINNPMKLLIKLSLLLFSPVINSVIINLYSILYYLTI